jgi:hypothetical protein
MVVIKKINMVNKHYSYLAAQTEMHRHTNQLLCMNVSLQGVNPPPPSQKKYTRSNQVHTLLQLKVLECVAVNSVTDCAPENKYVEK